MNPIFDFFNSISPLSEETKSKLKPLFKSKTLNKHDLFINEGEKAIHIGFLEKGVIRAFFRNTEGKEYNKHFFTSPSLIGGYASIITQQPNQIIQEALTDCVIWEVKYSELAQLFDQHQDLERMARKLAEHFFVAKEQREIELVLLNATERYRIFQKQYPELEQQISQYHIASYLGITPTQLSRIRSAL